MMNLKRCRAQSKNKSLVNSSATYIKLLDYAERLEAENIRLNETIFNMGIRYKRMLTWIKSLSSMSNHGIHGLSEYEVIKKSTHEILTERRELLENA